MGLLIGTTGLGVLGMVANGGPVGADETATSSTILPCLSASIAGDDGCGTTTTLPPSTTTTTLPPSTTSTTIGCEPTTTSPPVQTAGVVRVAAAECPPTSIPTGSFPVLPSCVGSAVVCDPQPSTTTAAPVTTIAPVLALQPEVAPTTVAASHVLGAQLAETGSNTDPLTWTALALIALGMLTVTLAGRRRGAHGKR